MRSRFMPLLAVLALAACADTPAPTEPMSPAFDANPESSGAVIIRMDVTPVLTIYDAGEQLLVAHVFRDPYAACVPAGTPFDFELAQLKDVISAGDPDRVREFFTAPEIFIKVWHSTRPNWTVALRCSQPIASGVGHMVYTDNDLNAWLGGGPNVNAFGWMAQATLEGPDGQRYHYNGVYRMKWQPNVGAPDDRALEIVKVNLVPIPN